jgi:hypothetical protein
VVIILVLGLIGGGAINIKAHVSPRLLISIVFPVLTVDKECSRGGRTGVTAGTTSQQSTLRFITSGP